MNKRQNSVFSISACLAGALFVSLLVTACLDPIAWSPNGRYMAFAFGESRVLHLWDSRYDTMRTFEDIKDVISCRFLPYGREILFLADEDLKRVSIETGKTRTVVTGLEEDDARAFDTPRNGKYLYYVKETEEGIDQLVRKRLWHPSQQKALYESETEMTFPAVNSDDTQVLFSTVDDEVSRLHLLNVAEGSVCVVREKNDRCFYWGRWTDHNQIIYVLWDEDGETGEFYSYDLSNNQETLLCDSVAIFRPSFDETHNRVVLTCIKDAERELYEVVLVDLCSGEVSRPLKDAEGTCLPIFSPCGRKLAYMESSSKADTEKVEYNLLKTINLETSEISTIFDFRGEAL